MVSFNISLLELTGPGHLIKSRGQGGHAAPCNGGAWCAWLLQITRNCV